MKLLKLVPDNTNIDFMKWRNFALILSIIATVASLTLVGVRGLNLGIDFVGGQVVRATFAQPVDIEDLRGKVEQPQQVGDMAPRLVDDPGKLFLGMGKLVDEALIGLRFLDRVEILPLDILDQRNFERLLVGEVADDRRNFVEPRPLRRPPTPLAGDDLETVTVGTNDDRLDDAARPDRFGKLGKRLFLEDPSRLAGVRLDPGDRDHLHRSAPRSGAAVDRRLLGDLAEQGGEAAAKAGGPLLRQGRVAHAASAACLGSRRISSRASAI